MPYDINAALQRLEQNLNDLDSARKQVENAVKASSNLQSVVAEYVSSIETLCVRLKKWDADLNNRENLLPHEVESMISQLTTSCSQIVSTFNNAVEGAASDFKFKSDSLISKFDEQNNKLAERVQEMNTFRDFIKKTTEEIQSVKEILIQISKDLKESQDSQDAVLIDIKQKVETFPTVVSSIVEGINPQIASIQDKADSIYSLLTQVNSLGIDIKSALEQNLSTVQSSTESLLNSIESSKKETTKSINVNRWITIIFFIILIIFSCVGLFFDFKLN